MGNYPKQPLSVSSSGVLIAVSVFLTALTNAAFFFNVLDVYPITTGNVGFVISVAWVFCSFTLVLLLLLCRRHTTEPVVITLEAQRHVSAVIWVGDNFDEIDIEALAAKRDDKFRHDNIFHTVLGFMEIETSLYRNEMDILVHRKE